MPAKRTASEEPILLDLPGSAGDNADPASPRRAPVHVRRSSRARHIILRVDSARDRIELVVPDGAGRREAVAFARSKGDWLATQLEALPDRIPFKDGQIVPFRGIPHRIHHVPDATPSARGDVWVEAADRAELLVMGGAAHVSRRVADWLKKQAKVTLGARAREKAARLDLRPTRISVRDTRSRWGSCSRKRTLAFSWRLILAPDWVLDYVAAHEVAHLRHMDHGRDFWALCGDLTERRDDARAWLRDHGRALHRYG